MAEEEILLLKLRIQEDSKNASTINGLIKANKQLAKTIKDAPREGTEAYKKFEKQLDSAKKQYADNKKEIDKFNKSLKTGQKQFDNASDSLKSYSKNLKRLEDEYKSLSKTERKSAVGKQLQRQIKSTRAELLKAEKGLGDFRRQVGRYTTSLVGMNSGLGTIVFSLRGFSQALRGIPALFSAASTSAKVFLLTLGPISVVIAAITFALSKFQSVIDKFSGILAGASAVIDVAVERFGRLGVAFTKLRNFDFKGFATDAKAAFAGIGDQIKTTFDSAQGLSDALIRLRDDEINSIVRLATLERDIAVARRSSQEKEKTDREGAIADLQTAIALTNERADIEIGFAQRRSDALREQNALTDELTNAADRKAEAEALANVIKLEAARENTIRGLVRRVTSLSKVEKDANSEQAKGLKFLISEQTRLTEAIKEQILAGKDYSQNLNDLKKTTAEISKVNETFKEITEGTTEEIEAQKGSINSYNLQIEELTKSLGDLTIGSKEYESTSNQIKSIEEQRAAATGELNKSIEELNATQLESLAILEDTETELRIRQAAQNQIEALVGSSEEVAAKRLAIENDLQLQLNQIEATRLQDNQALLNDELAQIQSATQKELELFANNEIKKQEILLIAQGKRDEIRKKQLEIEKRLLEISVENYDNAENKKTAKSKQESENRKKIEQIVLDSSLEAASKIVELFSVLQEQQTQKSLDEINKREEGEIAEAELVGKTEEEKQAIRDKFAKEREQLEKQAANERKAIAISEALIDIAGSVLKALNTPPPANVALAATSAALGAIQLAIISATQFADGGLVRPVELSDGRIVNTPNISQMSNGDNILATVRVGEAVVNEKQIARLGGSSAFAAAGVPGFADGGKIDFAQIDKVHGYSTGGSIPKFTSPNIIAQAMANGGIATANQSAEVRQVFEQQNATLGLIIREAVAQGAAQGTRNGVENSNITGQISRENERTKRRTNNESV